jgi:hypothetical protein
MAEVVRPAFSDDIILHLIDNRDFMKRVGVFICATTFFLLSCTGKEDFTIGSRFTEDQTQLKIVDTFRVAVSTVMTDSVATSGTGTILVGNYSDISFGKLNVISYFEPGYHYPELDASCIFDSASIALVYSGYSYGDTNELFHLNIYQLDDYIETNTNYSLYNNEDVKISDVLIGSKSFYPQPSSTDTVFVPANAFGQMIFTKFMENDPDVYSAEQIVNFLKGFAVIADKGNSVIGFKAEASGIMLEMYYHQNGESVSYSTLTLPFGAASKQFNTIHTDFSNSPLASVKPDSKAIPSEQTGNFAYMQALVGLFPKITFPSLQDITYNPRWKILKGELVITPVVGSYSAFALPEQLCMYRTDANNQVGKVLSTSDGTVIYSSLVTDEIFNEYTNYTIDITSYLNDELADNYFDTKTGLLINLVSSDINKSLSRLMIQCGGTNVKLRLYYLSY